MKHKMHLETSISPTHLPLTQICLQKINAASKRSFSLRLRRFDLPFAVPLSDPTPSVVPEEGGLPEGRGWAAEPAAGGEGATGRHVSNGDSVLQGETFG